MEEHFGKQIPVGAHDNHPCLPEKPPDDDRSSRPRGGESRSKRPFLGRSQFSEAGLLDRRHERLSPQPALEVRLTMPVMAPFLRPLQCSSEKGIARGEPRS